MDPDVEIPYGEAKFPEFTIELTQGAEQMLRKQRMKPFPVKGSKYELLQRTVEQMTRLKKGFVRLESMLFYVSLSRGGVQIS